MGIDQTGRVGHFLPEWQNMHCSLLIPRFSQNLGMRTLQCRFCHNISPNIIFVSQISTCQQMWNVINFTTYGGCSIFCYTCTNIANFELVTKNVTQRAIFLAPFSLHWHKICFIRNSALPETHAPHYMRWTLGLRCCGVLKCGRNDRFTCWNDRLCVDSRWNVGHSRHS